MIAVTDWSDDVTVMSMKKENRGSHAASESTTAVTQQVFSLGFST